MSIHKRIDEWLKANDESAILLDGLERALIGLTYDVNTSSWRAIYSTDKCMTVFMDEGMTYTEAVEHFEHNVFGAYLGPQTPLFIDESII